MGTAKSEPLSDEEWAAAADEYHRLGRPDPQDKPLEESWEEGDYAAALTAAEERAQAAERNAKELGKLASHLDKVNKELKEQLEKSCREARHASDVADLARRTLSEVKASLNGQRVRDRMTGREGILVGMDGPGPRRAQVYRGVLRHSGKEDTYDVYPQALEFLSCPKLERIAWLERRRRVDGVLIVGLILAAGLAWATPLGLL